MANKQRIQKVIDAIRKSKVFNVANQMDDPIGIALRRVMKIPTSVIKNTPLLDNSLISKFATYCDLDFESANKLAWSSDINTREEAIEALEMAIRYNFIP